ncbi:MAG: nuclear transport factor 2 family protein [Actinomycetota bacterium]|nr:nuclear transport factor 2 family protein [Actinomycetota bacterium]MDQ5808522.1 nuclear transport factor 2 family protein [Actinomycetota bacterium]
MTAVEHVHALWSTFETQGALARLSHVDEECEWVPSGEFPEARPIRGAAAMRAYLEQLTRDGVRFEPALHTCEAIGDRVVVGGRIRVVSSAALSDSPLFWVYRLRDERVVRIESYASRREALTAAAA